MKEYIYGNVSIIITIQNMKAMLKDASLHLNRVRQTQSYPV